MTKQKGKMVMPSSFYFKIYSLERAIVTLAQRVRMPQNNFEPLRLRPTEEAMLLEAARIGYAKILENPSLIKFGEYQFP